MHKYQLLIHCKTMKKNVSAFFILCAALFLVNSIHAEDITPSPLPSRKFGEEVREMRRENNEKRKELREENEEEREDLIEKNKESREEFRTNTKNLMISKTPEERKILRPTIVQERKDLLQKNVESRKTLRETIQTRMDSFRQSVRTQWSNLWNSFFGKK